jgi:hypothetical protein
MLKTRRRQSNKPRHVVVVEEGAEGYAREEGRLRPW